MTDQIITRDWQLNIDVDMVLRGQGVNSDAVRTRQPRLVDIARRALHDGRTLIEPQAIHRFVPVKTMKHERLILADGRPLTGSRIAQHLGPARYIALIVCTIGMALDERIVATLRLDPSYALALDGFGSVAAEVMGSELCGRLEQDASHVGHCTSIPLSPGMLGWPIEVGQPQIFSHLDAHIIGVALTESAQMIPRKSTSMVLGFAPTPFEAGTPCDFCALRETCRYQHQ